MLARRVHGRGGLRAWCAVCGQFSDGKRRIRFRNVVSSSETRPSDDRSCKTEKMMMRLSIMYDDDDDDVDDEDDDDNRDFHPEPNRR